MEAFAIDFTSRLPRFYITVRCYRRAVRAYPDLAYGLVAQERHRLTGMAVYGIALLNKCIRQLRHDFSRSDPTGFAYRHFGSQLWDIQLSDLVLV